ncbi:MAG: radical SAM protein [Lachnospiraceae bacterium]|nr:radical SAM protein [Lachnospiraceae bacterium]
MKWSRFNYTYKTEKRVVLYNTFSKAILELDIEEYERFKNGDYGSEEIALIDNGIIVSDDYDECEFLKYIHYRTRFSSDVMTLTIAPTLDCNFDCPYCFENKRKGQMTEKVRIAIVDFIKNKVQNGVKKIDLTWYGGEPLLQVDCIKTIYQGVSETLCKNGAELRQFLITNGFLLSGDTVDVLEECGIRHIQITIDGKEEDHNKRRYLRGGKGTYDTIISNIKGLRGRDFRIDIRSNIDAENSSGYGQLQAEIDRIKDVSIRMYPAVTENINERRKDRMDLYMEHSQYMDFISEGRDEGTVSSYVCEVEDNRCFFCSAELENTFVIDELGNVYKCWDEIGKEESICFNVLNPDDINYEALLKYMGGDPFDRDDCKDCVFLPICFGGCRFQRGLGAHSVCVHTENSINEFLKRELQREGV